MQHQNAQNAYEKGTKDVRSIRKRLKARISQYYCYHKTLINQMQQVSEQSLGIIFSKSSQKQKPTLRLCNTVGSPFGIARRKIGREIRTNKRNEKSEEPINGHVLLALNRQLASSL